VNRRGAVRTAGALMAAALLCGCAARGPVAPLVPLADDMLPGPEELAYHPWRLVVAANDGPESQAQAEFTDELRSQIARYGIRIVSSDRTANRLIDDMLKSQVRSGREVDVKDVKYETALADGVISVTINAVTVPKRNVLTEWYDKKKKKTYRRYTSEVALSGSYTLVLPKTGNARTVHFSNTQTQTSYGSPHALSVHTLALRAAREAARGSRVMEPVYTQFPLTGYVIGTGERARDIRINRGADHGVRRNRKWNLVLRVRELNPLLGEITTAQVVGTAKTIEVHADTCIARCDSSRTRERAKLGMRVESGDFGFSLSEFFGIE